MKRMERQIIIISLLFAAACFLCSIMGSDVKDLKNRVTELENLVTELEYVVREQSGFHTIPRVIKKKKNIKKKLKLAAAS